MTKWLVWVLATLACGGVPEAQVAASSGGAAPQAETIVLGGDSRFAANDVPTPPPQKPQRRIDRGEAGPADLHKSRVVDKTLEKDEPNQPGSDAHDNSMLVYTAHVTMAVYQVTPALDVIEAVAREMGGCLALRNDTEIQIRVPRAHFEDALHKIEASGDVITVRSPRKT